MNNRINILILALAAGVLTTGLSGCQKTDNTAADAPAQKGPAERAGEKLDQAATEAARHLNKMAEGAGKGLEKAGESLQRESKDAQEKEAQAKDSQIKQEQK